jgi:predicted MFS family arabinose efflux permease
MTEFDGDWHLTIETPMGQRAASLHIDNRNGELSGTLEMPMGTGDVVGRLGDDGVEFESRLTGPMGEVIVAFSGSVNDQEVAGEVQFGTRQSSWRGRRGSGATAVSGEAHGGTGTVAGPGTAGSSRPSLRQALVVFRDRNYRYLWLYSASTFTGMQMQMVARGLLAWELTHQFSAVGAISLSFGLPMLLFSLVGGVAADRFDKRNLVLATQGFTGVLSLFTAVLVATDAITIQLLFIVGLFQGTFQALGMPARIPLMVAVVGPERMMSAIALQGAAQNATRLVGPALAGALVAAGGIEAAYFTQSFIYLITLTLLFRVPSGLGATAAGQVRRGMLGDIRHGLGYVRGNRPLLLLMMMAFIPAMLGMPFIMLLPGFVTDDLGRGASEFGLLLSISGAGALVASLVIASLTEFPRKVLLQAVAGVGAGVGLVLLGVWGEAFGYGGAVAAMIVLGLAFTAYQTLNNTLVISTADPEYHGRVMSIYMLTFSVMPLMAAPLGLLADAIGATMLFIAQGSLIIVFMVLVTALNPRRILSKTDGAAQSRRMPIGGFG